LVSLGHSLAKLDCRYFAMDVVLPVTRKQYDETNLTTPWVQGRILILYSGFNEIIFGIGIRFEIWKVVCRCIRPQQLFNKDALS
jgi:hypothetical protein